MSSPQLLLGLELEFYLPPDVEYEAAPNGSARGLQRRLLKDAVYTQVAKALQAADLPAAVLLNVRQSEHHSQLVKRALPGTIKDNLMSMGGTPIDESSIYPDYNYWLIKDEDDLWGDEQGWVAAKCSSPILSHPQATNDARKALTSIQASTNGRVMVNHRCGYHIHVSQGGDIGLEFTRRVTTLVFLLENHVLFPLVHPSRQEQNGPLATTSTFSTLRSSPGNAKEISAGFLQLPGTVRNEHGHKLRHLWTADNMDELQQLLLAIPRCYTKTALALKVHEHPDDSETWTLEFRHAQASFELGFFQAWMNLVVAICQLAMLPSDNFAAQLSSLNGVLRNSSLGKDEKIRRALSAIRFGIPGQAGSAFGLRIEDWQQTIGSYPG